MKRTIIAILLALALVVIPVSTAFAAKTATVTITATGGHLSITVDPTTWALGTVVEDETIASGTTYFTLTNDGTVTADIDIHGDDMTGGTPSWTLSDTATPGADIYGLQFERDAGGGLVTIPSTDVTYMDDLAASGTDDFGLEFLTPTSITDITNVQSTDVTFTAAKS